MSGTAAAAPLGDSPPGQLRRQRTRHHAVGERGVVRVMAIAATPALPVRQRLEVREQVDELDPRVLARQLAETLEVYGRRRRLDVVVERQGRDDHPPRP